jgi:hypothetical protein
LLGLDHKKLTYRYAGREMRLTDVKGKLVKAWSAEVDNEFASPAWLKTAWHWRFRSVLVGAPASAGPSRRNTALPSRIRTG